MSFGIEPYLHVETIVTESGHIIALVGTPTYSADGRIEGFQGVLYKGRSVSGRNVQIRMNTYEEQEVFKFIHDIGR